MPGGCLHDERAGTLVQVKADADDAVSIQRRSEFLEWLKASDVTLVDGLYFKEDPTTGPSLFCSEALPADVDVISVPVPLVLTPATARQALDAWKSSITELGETSLNQEAFPGSPHEAVVAYLMLCRAYDEQVHQHRGARSTQNAHHSDQLSSVRTTKRRKINPDNDQDENQPLGKHIPYIRILPRTILTPLHFHEAELDLLVSTPLHGATLDRLRKTAESYRKMMAWLLPGAGNIKTEAEQSERQIANHQFLEWIAAQAELGDESEALRVYRWAESAYGSRAFPPSLAGLTGEEDGTFVGPILIPGLDSFNHQRGRLVTWSYDAGPSTSGHDARVPSTSSSPPRPALAPLPCPRIRLTLHTAHPADSQVFNNYGAKSNEEWLGSYGFVDPQAVELDDTLTLVLGESQGDRSSVEEKTVKAPSEGDPDTQSAVQTSKTYRWRIGCGAPDGLLETIESRILAASEEDEDDAEQAPQEIRAEALHALLQMLVQKGSRIIDLSDLPEEERDQSEQPQNSLRPEVVRMVRTYLDSQSALILHAAQWAKDRYTEVVELLDQED